MAKLRRIISNNKWQISAIVLLSIILLLGGSARDDVRALIILRPITIAACFFYAAVFLQEDWRRIRFLLLFIAAVFAALLIQLVPLPPSLWQGLPGRDVIIAADQAAGIHDVWRPISMTPDRTINAAWAMFVPLSVLLSLGKLRSGSFRTVAFALILMALASALVGVLQVSSGAGSPLYLYKLASRGSATGFFANRNHGATFVACAIPLLFALSVTGSGNLRLERQRRWLFGFGIMLCFGLVLAIGSRAGVLIALLALLALPLLAPNRVGIYARLRPLMSGWRGWAVAGLALTLTVTSVVLSFSTQGMGRIASTDSSEVRLIYWKVVVEIMEKYAPVGSGFGSFVEIYKMHEPLSTLEPSYVNHAHNDLLELLMTGGVVGGLLAAFAVGAWVWSLLAVRRQSLSGDLLIFHRAGALILLMLAVASLTDYPLRTPFLAALAVVAAVWMARPLRAARGHDAGEPVPAGV